MVFRTLSPTRKRFWGFSSKYWKNRITDCLVAKKIGRGLIVQAAPELVDVVTKKKSPKQAISSILQKNVRKQVSGSKTGRIRKLKTNVEKPKKALERRSLLTRSWSKNFPKVQKDY